ncbi:MAG: MBL fold metallo-hydrolase [Patescibacteria group bacterium]
MQKSVKILGVTILILFIITSTVWYAVIREERGGVLTVSFLNVGQGDSIFIDAPSGRQVLIDGGNGRSVLRELSNVSPWYDRTIDVVIATHPDQDHIGGLPEVLSRYRVSLIVESDVKDENGADSAAFEKAAARETLTGAQRLVARRGQIIDLGDGAYIEILFPDRAVPAVETNTGSIVARLVYGDTAFMLTGDSPQSIEKYLAAIDGKKLHSNILKAGHHGSKTSSAELFVGFVGPEYAVFSRGCDNKYGHPHAGVVALFKRFEIPTLDTCKDGTITFVSDGNTLHLK